MSRRNSRHDTFCREYIIDLNGKRAAIAAGYGKKGAHVRASQLLSNRKVQALLAKLTKEKADKLDLDAEKVLSELSRMAFSNLLDYGTVTDDGGFVIDLSALNREQAAAIHEITVDEYMEGRGEGARTVKRTKFKLASKINALELLGKYLKLFTEKIEVSGLEQLPELMAEARKRVNDAG